MYSILSALIIFVVIAGLNVSSRLVRLFSGNVGALHCRKEAITQQDFEFDRLFAELYYKEIGNERERVGGALPRSIFRVNDWKHSSNGGLTDSDRVLLGDVYYNASSVFEFGLGESTQIAAHVGVPRYSGIDSDATWVAQTRENANLTHFRFYFADVGRTRAWGMPADEKLGKIPLTYQLQALYLELDPFDVYLVDGRYRVACAAASFLHALSRGAPSQQPRVLIHDADREEYKIALQIADIVERSDLLVVLRLKQNVTQHELASMWRKHAHSVKR